MGKKLIIAEKNSMARDICQAIGGLKYNSKEDFYEGKEYVVVALSGHVLKWFDMEDYDEKLKYWNIEQLPFFPSNWKLKEKSETYPKKKYNIAKKLILRDDITEIINAGDPDTEGEVLVNEVIYKVFEENKIRKNVKRIWILDHVSSTIQKELKYSKDIMDTNNIYEEGIARAKTDWLYGINLTRYISCRTGKTMATGRVIVPTVKFVYDRDIEIKNFIPSKYKEIVVLISKDNRDIKLNFNNLKFKEKDNKKIDEVLDKIKNKNIIVTNIEKREQIKEPKKLFKLSTLQIYCSNKYKFNPDKTLSIVQTLYEKGYLTYPRTNSEYMTEKEKEKAQAIIRALQQKGYSEIDFKDTKRIFDDSKIDSHSAITPTQKIADINILNEDEKKIYETVKNRFLSNFSTDKCELEIQNVTFKLDDYTTTLKGTNIKKQGYLKFENDLLEKDIPKFEIGENFKFNYEIEAKQTTPPSKVTQAELIKFYNKPFKKTSIEDDDVDDTEEYKNILKGTEIGTEATRAGTISKVLKIGYIVEEKGKLSITDLGIEFIETLKKLNINLWKEKTVELSQLLKEVSKGEKNIEDLLKYAEDEINNIISNGSKVEIVKNTISQREIIGKCPLCCNDILESKKLYYCNNYKNGCNFSIWKNISNKKINKTIVQELLSKKQTKIIKGFTSKSGKEFNAKLILKKDGTIGFEF